VGVVVAVKKASPESFSAVVKVVSLVDVSAKLSGNADTVEATLVALLVEFSALGLVTSVATVV